MKDELVKKYRDNFAGGVNSFLGVRQIKDTESPDMTNCDFMGKGGIGNREGYTEIQTVDADYNDGVYGLATLHTSAKHQLMRFTQKGTTDIKMEHSTDGGSWNLVADVFTQGRNIDSCQAVTKVYTGNGVDVMHDWDGTNWAHTTNGTIGYFPTYYGRRLWVVDETDYAKLNFSGMYGETGDKEEGGATASKLGDFSDATAGILTFPSEITGLKSFKNALYVFLRESIFKVTPATTANTFIVSLITNAVGCVSHRSIVQVEEDIYFAADDGVYALGEVANYVSVRTTNKSAKIKGVFDNLSATNKGKLSAEYFNFKYHLFYSLYGTSNDSCIAYDIRYGGWVDWRNIPANDAVTYLDSTNDKKMYIGHPTNSEVYKMYSGSDDNGTTIQSTFHTKSFDDDLPDTQKVYFDHTFVFGALQGTMTIVVRFNDNEVASTKTLSQVTPQGGFGRDAFGRKVFGGGTNTISVITNYRGTPIRTRVSQKKFAVQYKLTTSGQWRLDNITTTYKPLSHFAFPSQYKI